MYTTALVRFFEHLGWLDNDYSHVTRPNSNPYHYWGEICPDVYRNDEYSFHLVSTCKNSPKRDEVTPYIDVLHDQKQLLSLLKSNKPDNLLILRNVEDNLPSKIISGYGINEPVHYFDREFSVIDFLNKSPKELKSFF